MGQGYITYGGVDTLVPDREILDWIDKNVGLFVEFSQPPSSVGTHAGPAPTTSASPLAGSPNINLLSTPLG